VQRADPTKKDTASAVFFCSASFQLAFSCSQAGSLRYFDLMNVALLKKPLFYIAGHYVSFLGLLAFAILFAIGLITAKTLQSDAVRRFFARFKLDTNFIAIVTTILSVSALAFFTVTAINAAGVPLLWSAPLPGVTLSLVQIFLLIALLIAVFWFSSRTKRFLFNRFLVNSGLDRSLQYAIAQIVSNLVLVIGIFIVLENTGIHLGALTVFAGAVGVGAIASAIASALAGLRTSARTATPRADSRRSNSIPFSPVAPVTRIMVHLRLTRVICALPGAKTQVWTKLILWTFLAVPLS